MPQLILDNIPFQPDVAALQQKLRLRGGSQIDHLERLATDAQAIARPKALYKVACVESKGDDYVMIDGIRFNSRVLRVNLEQAHHVFPHIVTCGMELHEWANSIGDMMKRYWADTIITMALHSASRALNEHLTEHYRPGQTSCISPGVFPEWPIRQQRPLFKLLGDPQEAIGVQLLKSCMMVPTKSTSGIIFPIETDFVICQLCATDYCPGRRLPYDETLFDRKYRLKS
jgi:hypothetical protein